MLTLSAERKLLRKQRAEERRKLKKRMDGYNSLSNRSKSEPLPYDSDSAYTIHDISLELYSEMHRETAPRMKKGRGIGIVQDVVSHEVREMWHAKIGLATLLTDSTRERLLKAPRSSFLRETRLMQLAAWMVEQYYDIEGYDPEKHLKGFSEAEMSR